MKPRYIRDEEKLRRALAHVDRDLERLRNPAGYIAERERERNMILAWAAENGWATPDKEGK